MEGARGGVSLGAVLLKVPECASSTFHMTIKEEVRPKEEPESTSRADCASETGALYADHVVKEELVLGPVCVQHKPNIRVTIKEELRLKEEPEYTSRADCAGETGELYAEHVVKEELVLGPVCVQLKPNIRGVSRPLVSDGEPWPERGGVTQRKPAGTTGAEYDTVQHNSITCTQQHTVETHTYKCDTCGQIALQKQCLIDHVNVHLRKASETLPDDSLFNLEPSDTSVKKYSCEVCKKQFTVLGNLRAHKRIHTGERPYSCNICMKSFTQSHYLKIHKRSHTGEKPYSCAICKKGFAQKSSLQTHIRTHTGEKAYSCNICMKSFTKSGYLKVHKRNHTGEKPFSCEICKEGFAQKCNLQSHIRTHTGEKPYCCTMCTMRFTQRSNLNRHKRTHVG